MGVSVSCICLPNQPLWYNSCQSLRPFVIKSLLSYDVLQRKIAVSQTAGLKQQILIIRQHTASVQDLSGLHSMLRVRSDQFHLVYEGIGDDRCHRKQVTEGLKVFVGIRDRATVFCTVHVTRHSCMGAYSTCRRALLSDQHRQSQFFSSCQRYQRSGGTR